MRGIRAWSLTPREGAIVLNDSRWRPQRRFTLLKLMRQRWLLHLSTLAIAADFDCICGTLLRRLHVRCNGLPSMHCWTSRRAMLSQLVISMIVICCGTHHCVQERRLVRSIDGLSRIFCFKSNTLRWTGTSSLKISSKQAVSVLERRFHLIYWVFAVCNVNSSLIYDTSAAFRWSMLLLLILIVLLDYMMELTAKKRIRDLPSRRISSLHTPNWICASTVIIACYHLKQLFRILSILDWDYWRRPLIAILLTSWTLWIHFENFWVKLLVLVLTCGRIQSRWNR